MQTSSLSYDPAQQTGAIALLYGALMAIGHGDFLTTGDVRSWLLSTETWATLGLSIAVGAGLWHHRRWALWLGAFLALVQLIRLDLLRLVNDVATRPNSLSTVVMVISSLLLVLFLTMLMQPSTQEACEE
jgi:hypothetical protein